MTHKLSRLATAFVLAVSAPAIAFGGTDANVVKATYSEETGAAERIEAVAKLRILSQETASAACHMAQEISADEAQLLMVKAKTEFHTILDALQYGDAAMGIVGSEQNKKINGQIDALRSAWTPMFDAGVALLVVPQHSASLATIKAESETVLAAASLLTTEMVGKYSNPAELRQTDAMLIDFSARQAMLTQKMAKVSCEILAGNRSDDRMEVLGKTMQMYGLTLNAMLNGMPAVGLRAAPTDEIAAALSDANAAWAKIEAELNMVMAGAEVPQEVKLSLYQDLNLAMSEMTQIENLYVAYSKHSFEKGNASIGAGS